MKKVEDEINGLVKSGVTEPVDKPTDWCLWLWYRSGNVCLCMDLTKLNEGVHRGEKGRRDSWECISSGTVFSELGANSGFHQVALMYESTKFTMFITPFGRFMFRRLPYGISSAPEYFQKRMDKELTGLQGVLCHMDDILVIGQNKEEHDEHLVKVLQHLKDSGIKLNPDKCLFFTSGLQYLGQVIDSDGIRKDPAKVKAIKELLELKDVPDVR